MAVVLSAKRPFLLEMISVFLLQMVWMLEVSPLKWRKLTTNLFKMLVMLEEGLFLLITKAVQKGRAERLTSGPTPQSSE